MMLERLDPKTTERMGRCNRKGAEMFLSANEVAPVYQRLKLLAALERLADEETWDGASIMSLLGTSAKRKVTASMVATLIGHLAAGRTNKLIALDLGISPTAVSQIIRGKYPGLPENDQVPAVLGRILGAKVDL